MTREVILDNHPDQVSLKHFFDASGQYVVTQDRNAIALATALADIAHSINSPRIYTIEGVIKVIDRRD